MAGLGELLTSARVVVLVGGFGYAAVADLRAREVSDRLWQLLAALAVALGLVVVAGGGALAIGLWVLVGAFAFEHLLPWDDALGERHAGKVLWIELAVYVGVVGLVGAAAVRWGIGPSSVPIDVVAAVASIVVARVLFETGVLYGGADAKALIVVGVLLPVFAVPLLYAPAIEGPLLARLPFSITLLTDAALFSVLVPIALAIRNLSRGEFTLPRGFTCYTLDVRELPRRFVWVRDPALGEDTTLEDAETSEEDIRQRTRIARDLQAQGVQRVWVSPQLPFLVLMAAGAFAGLLAGNLLLDLFAAL